MLTSSVFMRGSTKFGLFHLIAILTLVETGGYAQQPDPVELVTSTIAHTRQNFIVSQGYTSEKFAEWRYYDKHGIMLRDLTWQFDVVFVSGSWYFRLTARNGNPLTGAEAEREQKNWDEMISGMRARLPAELKHDTLYSFALQNQQGFRTRVTREPIPFEDLPRLFDLKLVGVEDVLGRPAYVIEAEPRPAAVPADKWEEAELHDRVKVWIDVAEKIPLRLHLDVLTDRPLVAKGSWFDMEWAKVNDTFWAPTHDVLNLPKTRAHFEGTFSNFKKFDVTSRILADSTRPVTRAAQPTPGTQGNVASADETAIRSVVENGFAAYQRGDFRELFALFSEKSPNVLAGKMDVENNAAYFGKDQITDLQVDPIEIGADGATVRLSFARRSTAPGRSQGRRFFTFQLVREEGSWKLWTGEGDESELASALLAAENDTERDGLLAEHARLVTEELADQLVGRGNALVAQGEYTSAVASFQLAYKVADRLGDKSAVWKALYGLGHGNLVQGKIAEADDSYRQSLAVCRELGNPSDLSFVLYQIGRDHAERGDYGDAMESYHKSLAIGEEAGKERIASTLEGLGDLFLQQGNDEQALEQYRRSLKLFQELESGVEVKLKVTASLGKIADVLTRQGNYQQALDHYQKNLALLQELDAPVASAFVLRRIGDNYAAQGLLPQALENYQKSLTFFQDEEHKPGIAATLDRIAALYSKRGEYDRAIASSRQALEIAQRLADPSELSRIQTTLGQAYLAERRYDSARNELESAISNVEKLRTQVTGTERDRELFFEGRVNPYNSMVELLIQQHDFSRAFSFAELAKARVLYEVLGKDRESISRTMSLEERKREQALNQALVTLNSQLEQERIHRHPSKVLLHSLEAQLKQARLAHEAFESAVYAAHPELKIQRGDTRPVSLEEIADLITDDSTALLEYVVTPERTYLFALTLDPNQRDQPLRGVRLNVYSIDIVSQDLALRAAAFRRKLATNSLEFREQARQLYDLLLAPARKDLAGKNTLCVVPSGPLWELPFQALLSARNRYVVQDDALFYVPSLSVLREIRTKEGDADPALTQGDTPQTSTFATHLLLAVANPELAINAGRRSNPAPAESPFAPLPEQERLVRTLAQIYGPGNSTILTGKAAQEGTIKATAGRYRILHFAAHGVLNNDDPMYSGLLLSSASQDEDGFLEAREIAQMELHADVAVLSACETARGKVHEGEGVMGMSWALFVAGTPTTVVSLWQIDSAGTAKLMTVFHRALWTNLSQRQRPPARATAVLHPRVSYRLLKSRSGESELRINKAQALRQAALALMAQPKYAHPFYWAAFVVVGDGF
jgi:CHAT domain-containing protein/tetratricopeptide (TPR) repeat protein